MPHTRTLRPWVKGLLLAHRYLGTLLAPVFAVWFLSGLVTVFVAFPAHDRQDRIAAAPPPLAGKAAEVAPATAWSRGGGGPDPDAAWVVRRSDRPVYNFQTHGRWGSIFADTGGRAPPIGPAAAEDLVAARTGADSPRHLEGLEGPDQWTFDARYRGHRPLHRVALEEGRGTVAYLSGRTGEIVQKVARPERWWAYAGPVAHRLYPAWLRANHALWKGVVVTLAGAGIVVCLSGLVIGLLGLIRRRPLIPWRFHGAQAWHHYLGLVFGLFALGWSLSGMLAVDPWGWPGNGPALPEDLAPGDGLDLAAFTRTPSEAVTALKGSGLSPRALALVQVGERPWYVAHGAEGATRLVAAQGPVEVRGRLGRGPLVAAVERVLGQGAVARAEWLRRPDAYYYPGRRVRLGEERLRWPVLRVRLYRPEGARLYLDPHTGEVARRVTDPQRWDRWLQSGIHHLDPPVLAANRGWWYALVLGLLVGGSLLALSGLYLGGRWLHGRGY
ncbi:PepSY domain-containing protein [Thiohalorhabdus sp.]|uniref:PepSY domain-containing protein n=1 Tax=Thiohalorhabdus sp. TaxID=3094134 RepID=UPI002FC30E38